MSAISITHKAPENTETKDKEKETRKESQNKGPDSPSNSNDFSKTYGSDQLLGDNPSHPGATVIREIAQMQAATSRAHIYNGFDPNKSEGSDKQKSVKNPFALDGIDVSLDSALLNDEERKGKSNSLGAVREALNAIKESPSPSVLGRYIPLKERLEELAGRLAAVEAAIGNSSPQVNNIQTVSPAPVVNPESANITTQSPSQAQTQPTSVTTRQTETLADLRNQIATAI